MKRFETKDIRNVVVVGHGGAGKTSLAEAMLFDARTVTRLGLAGTDSSSFDYEPEEIRRQGTIQTAVGWVEWQKRKINLIDTPGDLNFIVDTRTSMALAADVATLVVSCPDGVQVGTEKVWEFCEALALPRVIFINKMDRDRADWEACVADLRASLSDKVVLVQLPIGRASDFAGVVELMSLRAIRFSDDGTQASPGDVPAELADAARRAHEKLVEEIASSDDTLLETWLGTGELRQDELVQGLRKAILTGSLVPVLFGAAGKNLGIQPFLDFLATECPAPDMRGARPGTDEHGHLIERAASTEQPFAGRVFKTLVADIGKVSLVRVLSGRLAADSTVYNADTGGHERTGAIYALVGKKRETVTEVSAGDIIGLAKLKGTKTGHTLCDEKAIFRRPPIDVPEPVIKYAVRPKSKGDDDRLGAKLHDFVDEDIALRVERDPFSKEILLCGMGQSHVEVTVEKLRRHGIEVELLPPKIPYLETIKGRAQHVEGKHKKQTGGKGQYAVCTLHVEALPRGGGFEFVDAIVGGTIPRQFIPSVEKGIRDRMSRGVVAGFPVTDVRVTVVDGKFHDVDSDSRSFEMAGSKGFQAGFRACRPVLLEPIVELEITCDDSSMGDVMGDINARRGRVLGMESRGKGQVIKATVPMSESLKYAADLRSMTGGRGSFTVAFSHYDELVSHLADKVISAHKMAHEAEEE